MKTIVDIRIAPAEAAAVTPCELLEDFADSTPAWHFLEEESAYYSALKGVPSCVLRHMLSQPYRTVDFAFSGCSGDAPGALRLVLIDAEHPSAGFGPEQRHEVLGRFVETFRTYMSRQHRHALVEVAEADLETAA
jgi:hypothetical protein